MLNTEFPEIVNQMKLRGEKLLDMVKLLGYKEKSQVSRRLSGEIEWSLGDIEIICEHYDMDFYKLFKRKEK